MIIDCTCFTNLDLKIRLFLDFSCNYLTQRLVNIHQSKQSGPISFTMKICCCLKSSPLQNHLLKRKSILIRLPESLSLYQVQFSSYFPDTQVRFFPLNSLVIIAARIAIFYSNIIFDSPRQN